MNAQLASMAAELPQHARKLDRIVGTARERRDGAGEFINNLKGTPYISVPEIPFEAR
jgi:hypothetical protein